MKHINIPIFIPHLGCPNTCVFCNQRSISGVREFELGSVRLTIEEHLKTASLDDEVEIAFFGGSFTGIDRGLMISLLDISKEYVERGLVQSVRCSTRPDYINEEILDILSLYKVKIIELGIQSASEKVLKLSKRGHGIEDTKRAMSLIKERGFSLVGQMMIGLPGSDLDSEIKTAELIISSGAVGARIYPTVVFKDTELMEMSHRGEYIPLTLEEATDRSAEVLMRFINGGVPVIRIGLCSNENLDSENTYYGGPNHPAIGELVINKLYYKLILEKASEMKLTKDDVLVVYVSRTSLSKAVGQHAMNRKLLKSVLGIKDIRFVESDSLTDYSVKLQTETGEKQCI